MFEVFRNKPYCISMPKNRVMILKDDGDIVTEGDLMMSPCHHWRMRVYKSSYCSDPRG